MNVYSRIDTQKLIKTAIKKCIETRKDKKSLYFMFSVFIFIFQKIIRTEYKLLHKKPAIRKSQLNDTTQRFLPYTKFIYSVILSFSVNRYLTFQRQVTYFLPHSISLSSVAIFPFTLTRNWSLNRNNRPSIEIEKERNWFEMIHKK